MSSPRRVAAVVAAMATIALAPASAQGAGDCAGADVVPSAENLREVGQATLCLLNVERAAHGLGALNESALLTGAADAYSARMVREAFFAHVAPDGTDLVARLSAAGYIAGVSWAVGENIAWGQGPLSSARQIVTAWMQSPGHRANVLAGDYVEIGIGIAPGTPGDLSWGATYTTEFGTRAGAGRPAVATAASTAPTSPRAARAQRAPRGHACGRAATARRTGSGRPGRLCARSARRAKR